ncbi:hypothetical protein BDL97_15G098500 [Sphagnum fallax]|jgi:hypothetical protein|nr:hypothetical protein BDL97_15G098500 [Sphagnum fallax]KAH8940605.1 hypothetical protein BDL97_15G098500 [Sphagnum fallax]KAH8940606.1 hypothetical protein BDL97_15G098500 [Sphagnum fallax]KAH8940607.1 hypothetical protein BDL97_15G098500 [Sphagnum fallax]
MVINMHLTMNHCQEELEAADLMHQAVGSVDSAISAGDQQSPGSAIGGAGSAGGCLRERPVKVIPCPRCQSMNTKFCYYNNYSVNQPRHFCRNCQRYWTVGGTLRNVPVGGGSRKKVRTRGGQRNDIGSDQATHDRDPRAAGLLQGGSHGLLNMTLQPNVLLPSTIEMAATQQQLSILSQVTGGRLGSCYQLLQPAAGLMEPPTSTTTATATSQLSTFLQFPNMDQRSGQNGSYNAAIAAAFSKSAPASAATGGLQMNQQQQQQQDHHHLSTTLHSAMYDLQTSAMPNSTLQMGSGMHHAGPFSNHGGLNNHPQNYEGNHIEFFSSLMHKPGYWGA